MKLIYVTFPKSKEKCFYQQLNLYYMIIKNGKWKKQWLAVDVIAGK